MSKYMSTDQFKSYLIRSINQGFTSMSADEIRSTLLAGLASLEDESEIVDKRTLYTSRDIQEIRNYLISQVMTLTDKWSDFNESDTGMVLVELMAGLADMLGFYLDKSTLECYIGTVKQRKNGAGILALIGYKMRMTNSCVTTGRFVLSEPLTEDVVIPQYTQVSAIISNKETIKYATQYAVMIPAGVQSIDVPLIQGEVTKSYVKVGDLKTNQKIQILTSDIAQNSMIIEIDGVTWEEVKDVVLDDVAGRKYSVFEDKDCNPYVFFHNSYKDYLTADDNAKAEFTYLVSLGPKGKIKEGMITKLESKIELDGQDISDKFEVTNIDAASGGAERESLDEARIQAPKTLSMLGKAITLDDYHDMAMEIPGVLKVSALDWSISNGKYVNQPYIVKLYIVPTDGDECSNEQLESIVSYFGDNRMPSSMTVKAFQANYRPVNVVAKVHANTTEKNKEILRSQIESAIKNYFSSKNMEFGSGIKPSNIITLIETTSNAVRYVELSSPSSSDEDIDLTQFPILGELSIEVIVD